MKFNFCKTKSQNCEVVSYYKNKLRPYRFICLDKRYIYIYGRLSSNLPGLFVEEVEVGFDNVGSVRGMRVEGRGMHMMSRGSRTHRPLLLHLLGTPLYKHSIMFIKKIISQLTFFMKFLSPGAIFFYPGIDNALIPKR